MAEYDSEGRTRLYDEMDVAQRPDGRTQNKDVRFSGVFFPPQRERMILDEVLILFRGDKYGRRRGVSLAREGAAHQLY